MKKTLILNPLRKNNLTSLLSQIAAKFFLTVAGMFFFVGCSDIPQKPFSEIMGNIKRPTTPEEILRNVKIAIDNDLMSKRELYTEENFRKIFGGSKTNIYRENVQNLAAESYEFNYLEAGKEGVSNQLSPLEIILRFPRRDSKSNETLFLQSERRGLFPEFSRCIQIFGPGSKHFDVFQPHGNYDDVKTNRFGNESIRYLKYGAARGELILQFFGDGTLYQMSFRENANG